MASAFSAPDAAVITHQPTLDESLLLSTSASTGRPIAELYDIFSTAERIVQGRFQRVALQFPDEGLPDAVPIYWALKDQIAALCEKSERAPAEKPELFVLADTSYGNCCVDEVAAQHVDADVVVHYGHACLSPTARLPVIYVFPKRTIDVKQSADALMDAAINCWTNWDGSERKAILVSYDIGYSYAAEDVFACLQASLRDVASASSAGAMPPLVLAKLDTERNYEAKLKPTVARTANGECAPTSQTSTSCCRTSPPTTNSTQPSSGCCGSAGGCSSTPPLPRSSESVEALLGSDDGSGRRYALPEGASLPDCLVLYIGGESLALTNLLLRTGPSCPVVAFDPYKAEEGCKRLDGKTNRLLMRRYAAVQKARDASVVGLLVGTLGVQSYLPLLGHLRKILTGRGPGEKRIDADEESEEGEGSRRRRRRNGAGRKVYTISVGKLSPAKLANFQEVDIFVLLACPENSLVDAVDPTGTRSRDFYKPIVTPYEMMLALDESRAWTGEYILEMNRLVGSAVEAVAKQEGGTADRGTAANSTTASEEQGDDGDGDDDEDRPHFSLVTGGYVSRKHFGHDTQDADGSDDEERMRAENGAVVLRDANGQLTHVLNSANAMHLSTRSWRGLEQRLGMDAPSVLEEGRAGIAKGYAEADGTREG
ncbi:unnamed protein product [Parajaminaea phylloscopi]